MLATSVAVHEPSATSSNSTGDGAVDRWLSVSSAIAWPEGVIPRNKSSLTNRTSAFRPGTDIDKRITHDFLKYACYDSPQLVGPHDQLKGKTQKESLKSFSPRRRLSSWRGGPDMADILVVDDDEVIRETLDELLSASYSCQTADTAEAALAKLEAQRFDVVLTDISMPGLNGMELLERVVKKYPGTPVIIISGHSDQDHAQGLISRGAFDYLLKPFRLEVVEESVRRAVDKSKL